MLQDRTRWDIRLPHYVGSLIAFAAFGCSLGASGLGFAAAVAAQADSTAQSAEPASGIVAPQKKQPADKRAKPLKALLIAGGCCHDYPNQIEILKQGISQRANIQWEVLLGFDARDRQLPIYQTDDWARGYDLIVHNECYGGVTDVELVERIVRGHTKHQVPLVAIHCSMHSYRNAKTEAWRNLLGVTSVRHERGGTPLDVINRAAEHPIMTGFGQQWRTPNGELYVIEKVWPNCQPLATAFGKGTKSDQTVIWINEFESVRVFGTTLGHHNVTMLEAKYLDVVARGALWACGKLDDGGQPLVGYEGTGVGAIKLPGKVIPSDAKVPTPAKPEK